MTNNMTPWWRIKGKEELLSRLRGLGSSLSIYRQQAQCDRYTNAWLYQRDYFLGRYGTGRAALANGGPESLRRGVAWLDEDAQVPSPNIMRSTVDTVVAWIFGEHVPISVSSAGVGFEDRFAVEDYESALDTMMGEPDVHAEVERFARDAVLGGHGAIMPVYEGGKITARRLAPWQVMHDPCDARGGHPKTVHVIDLKDREGIECWLEAYQVSRAKITRVKKMAAVRASSFLPQWRSVYDNEIQQEGLYDETDRLVVMHSWRTSPREGEAKGRYVCTVWGAGDEGLVVHDVPYTHATLPVVSMAPMPNEEGIWGTGFGHLMRPWQEALDRSFFKIQRAMDKYGHLKMLADDDPSNLATDGNLRARVTPGIQTMFARDPSIIPRLIDQNVIRPEDIAWIDRILSLSQSIYGINSMMTRGASQLGAGASGVAQQEEYYRSLDRFTPVANAYKRARYRLAEEMMHLLDQVLAYDPEYKAAYVIYEEPRETTWSDLRKQVRGVTIRLEERGSAALSRAGRTARIQEQAAGGMMDGDTAKEALMTTPDVRRSARLATAGIRLVEWQVRGIITHETIDEYLPNKDTPLDFAVSRARQYIQLSIVHGAKPETIDRLREYVQTAQGLMRQMQPEPMPQGGLAPGTGAMPQGVPGLEAPQLLT